MSIRDSGAWSKPFSLDAVGTSSALSIPFRQNGAEVHLGMSTQEGEGKVRLRMQGYIPGTQRVSISLLGS